MNALPLSPDQAQLIVVDVQGRLARMMHESDAVIGQVQAPDSSGYDSWTCRLSGPNNCRKNSARRCPS